MHALNFAVAAVVRTTSASSRAGVLATVNVRLHYIVFNFNVMSGYGKIKIVVMVVVMIMMMMWIMIIIIRFVMMIKKI